MKFIHTSDIHIGASPDPNKFWSKDRSNDIKETFANIINLCKSEDVDLLLISGNLFSHQPLTEELNFVNNLFKSIPKTKVYITAGSSDYIKPNSPVLNFEFSSNVHYLLNDTIDSLDVENNNIVINGFSYFSIEDNRQFMNSFNIENDGKIHILLFYGGDISHAPFDINKLSEKPFAYAALGSKHKFEELSKNKIYYSGSPEPLNQNDIGEHGIILGEINENTKRVSKIKFIETAKVKYLPIKIKINSNTTIDDVIDLVTKEVIKHGIDNIYKIELTGMRNPDIEFNESIFDKKIRIISFIDSSNPKYDFVKLSSEHPQDMIGAFIRKMTLTNIELSETEKKALYYGTHALIKSTEKEEKI